MKHTGKVVKCMVNGGDVTPAKATGFNLRTKILDAIMPDVNASPPKKSTADKARDTAGGAAKRAERVNRAIDAATEMKAE